MLLGDDSGLYRIEIAGNRVASKPVKKDAATNHFILEEMAELEASGLSEQMARNTSKLRYTSGQKFINEEKVIDVESLKKFLQSSGNVDDWCRTGVFPDEGWTTASHIIDTAKGKFYSLHGPCFPNSDVKEKWSSIDFPWIKAPKT